MKRLNVVNLSAMMALGLILLPSSSVGQQKTLKDQLIGSWTLVSWERTNPDGSKINAFGDNPKGITIYTADSRYALIYTRRDLPKLSANDRLKATPQEAKTIMDGAIAYYGTYSVDEASRTVTLTIESTTFPNQIGRQNKRVIDVLTANELKLSNPASTAGGVIRYTMKRAD